MGLLDQILGGVLRGGAGGANLPGLGRGGLGGNVLMALLPVVLQMIAQRQRGSGAGGGLGGVLGGGQGGGMGGGLGGGLGGLLEQFTRRGYGGQAQSWISTGPNEPLPPQALDDVLGHDQIADIAAQAGLGEDETREGLAQLLPDVVDQLTPSGQLPPQDQLLASIDAFEQRLRGG